MELDHLNMYERLRDFKVPSPILDEIFASSEMLNTLKESWELLRSDGLKEDEIAQEIARLIFKEVDIEPDDYIE